MATLSFPTTSASTAPTVTTLEASPEAKTCALPATNKPDVTNNATPGLSEPDITSSFLLNMQESSHIWRQFPSCRAVPSVLPEHRSQTGGSGSRTARHNSVPTSTQTPAEP